MCSLNILFDRKRFSKAGLSGLELQFEFGDSLGIL